MVKLKLTFTDDIGKDRIEVITINKNQTYTNELLDEDENILGMVQIEVVD